MDPIDAVIVLFIATWLLRLILRGIVEKHDADEYRDKLREVVDKAVREVKLESLSEHGLMLAYDKENNDFLGQGKTLDEVKNMIMERYPKKIFLMDDGVMFTAIKLDDKNEVSNAS